MPCYVVHARPPTREEFALWKQMGFQSTWEHYCAIKNRAAGDKVTICGDLGAHCHRCAGVGELLCDFPVGDGKTCDAAMCEQHAHEIGPELHYCQAHYQMWVEYRDSGALGEDLGNVVAFRRGAE